MSRPELESPPPKIDRRTALRKIAGTTTSIAGMAIVGFGLGRVIIGEVKNIQDGAIFIPNEKRPEVEIELVKDMGIASTGFVIKAAGELIADKQTPKTRRDLLLGSLGLTLSRLLS